MTTFTDQLSAALFEAITFKYNENHDELGRFSEGGGSGSGGDNSGGSSGSSTTEQSDSALLEQWNREKRDRELSQVKTHPVLRENNITVNDLKKAKIYYLPRSGSFEPHWQVSVNDVALRNPTTGTYFHFGSKQDAEAKISRIVKDASKVKESA